MVSEDSAPAADAYERRNRLYRARAIVLRRRDIGEADRVLTVLTLEYGKRRVVARGSRRTSSRLAGHLEPFCITSLLVARTRGLDIVSQAEVQDAYPRLRQRELTIAAAGYAADLVDQLLPEEEVHEDVFELLAATLRLLDEGRDLQLVRVVFEMGLLRALGYRPELAACIACGSAIGPGDHAFSPEGGVVCADCARLRPEALPLGLNALKLLRAIDRGDIERLFGVRVPQDAWRELDPALGRYIARITGKESAARQVLAQLGLQ